MPIITAPRNIAPNWMDFSHYNYAVIDDKFYTFAYISDTGYEKNVTAGWLNQSSIAAKALMSRFS